MRKVLPSILGFPDKKRGPGRLLDPDDVDPDKFSLAILFFTEIEQGREPDEALANATRKLPPRFASAELKTLKRWVAQAMKLDDEPTTAADWRSALRSGFSDLLTLLNIVEESRETLP